MSHIPVRPIETAPSLISMPPLLSQGLRSDSTESTPRSRQMFLMVRPTETAPAGASPTPARVCMHSLARVCLGSLPLQRLIPLYLSTSLTPSSQHRRKAHELPQIYMHIEHARANTRFFTRERGEGEGGGRDINLPLTL